MFTNTTAPRLPRPVSLLLNIAALLVVCFFCSAGCSSARLTPPDGVQPVILTLKTTGYCNCGKCCSWKRSWFGLGSPVISAGPNTGKPKIVGQTASGVQAQAGTIAADTGVLPMNTLLYIPGYGYGRVEDRGGAIKGRHIDLWFPSHSEAKRWGVKTLKVKVWKPSKTAGSAK